MSGEETAQMKLELPVVCVDSFGFAQPKPKTPKTHILNGEDVLVPVIDGPFGERCCEDGKSCFLLVANTSREDLEREVQGLLENGKSFDRKTCPHIFDDAFVIEVFASSKGTEGILRRAEGKVRLSAYDGNASVEKKLSLILNIRQEVPGIHGWVRIDSDPKRSKR